MVMRLKNTVQDYDKHGILRHLVEGTRGAGAITQIIGYLDDLLNIFQASPSPSIMMCAL